MYWHALEKFMFYKIRIFSELNDTNHNENLKFTSHILYHYVSNYKFLLLNCKYNSLQKQELATTILNYQPSYIPMCCLLYYLNMYILAHSIPFSKQYVEFVVVMCVAMYNICIFIVDSAFCLDFQSKRDTTEVIFLNFIKLFTHDARNSLIK